MPIKVKVTLYAVLIITAILIVIGIIATFNPVGTTLFRNY